MEDLGRRLAGESLEQMMQRLRQQTGQEPVAPAAPHQVERAPGEEIVSTIMAPEDLGDHMIQVISTNHLEEYLRLPEFQYRHIDRALLSSKMDEAATEAYRRWAKIRRKYFGIATSDSTDLNIVFAFEPHEDPSIMKFVMNTAMIKKGYTTKYQTDVMFRISKKVLTLEGRRCYEIGRNIYAAADGTFFSDDNVKGILQGLVLADIEDKRKTFATDKGYLDRTADGLGHYVVATDSLGNIVLIRAWWDETTLGFESLKIR